MRPIFELPGSSRSPRFSGQDRGHPEGTVLSFRLAPDARAIVKEAASAVGLRALEVRHLNAACSALASQPCVLVVASSALGTFDKLVLTEHAWRRGAAVTWLDPGAGHDAALGAVRGVATRMRPTAYA